MIFTERPDIKNSKVVRQYLRLGSFVAWRQTGKARIVRGMAANSNRGKAKSKSSNRGVAKKGMGSVGEFARVQPQPTTSSQKRPGH
jgi:hypothetical protein